MSHSVDVRIPYEYKGLILDVCNYLDTKNPSTKSFQYGLLRALVYSPELTSDVLNPYALIDGLFLTQSFVQQHIIDRLEFIIAPTPLFTFLNCFPCLNSLGKPLSYRVVYSWQLNYHDRRLSRVEARNEVFHYVKNGGLDETRQLLKENYSQKIEEVNTAKILDSLSPLDVKRLGKCDWV